MVRSGRRPGDSKTREEILAAARAAFAEDGYDGSSIRGIARRAGVDPSLVHHYFGGKEELFLAAVQLPGRMLDEVDSLMGKEVDELGEAIVRTYLSVWEGDDGGGPMMAILRSAASNEQAASMLRAGVTHFVLERLAGKLEAPDARLRVSLVGSQIVGLAFARYIVRVEPLASADPATIVAAVAPTIQRYLTGELTSPQ
jgi:AcrR family transcriptional regulator